MAEMEHSPLLSPNKGYQLEASEDAEPFYTSS